jgi:uncharacterized protein
MSDSLLDILSTPSVKAAQAANGSDAHYAGLQGKVGSNVFTAREVAFIAARDSFYMASVAENGWPYVQHRGGPRGFLRVLDEKTFGFADFRGNRQYISLGNLGADNRVALFLMDYPNRRRLKILARAAVKSVTDDPELAARLATPGYKGKVERALLFRLKAFDWNCPQHITPRFTENELAEALEPVRERIASLELENKALRARLCKPPPR